MTDPDTTIQLSKIQKLLALYSTYLKRYPVLTRAVTSAILHSSSDTLSQVILKFRGQRHSFQLRSVLACALFGFVVSGPISGYFHKVLEKYVPEEEQNISYVKRYSVDRMAFVPVYLFLLLSFVELTEQCSLQKAWRNVKAVYVNALIKNWIVCPGLQATNMLLIPIDVSPENNICAITYISLQ
jgi:peroxisomal membrane protein 2